MTDKKRTYEQIAGWIIIRLLLGALLYCFLHYSFWIIHRDEPSIIGTEFSAALGQEIYDMIANSMIERGCVPDVFLKEGL